MTLLPFGLLVMAGAALVAQNLLMARMSGSVSTVLIALVMNSGVGFVLLSALLLRKTGLEAFSEVIGAFHPWFVIPGLLGSFFVFASIFGYQHLGAAPTIAVLIASQLVFGLAWDMGRSDAISLRAISTAVLGVGLMICGMIIIVSRHR